MYFLDFLKEYPFFCVILIVSLFKPTPKKENILNFLAAAKRRYSVFLLHAATVYSICCIIAADDRSLFFFMFQDGDPSLPPEKRNQVSFNFINTYANRYS